MTNISKKITKVSTEIYEKIAQLHKDMKAKVQEYTHLLKQLNERQKTQQTTRP